MKPVVITDNDAFFFKFLLMFIKQGGIAVRCSRNSPDMRDNEDGSVVQRLSCAVACSHPRQADLAETWLE